MEPGNTASIVTAGSLLVAAPSLVDPNFRRTLIMVCEHGAEGTFGLVLNRHLQVKPGDVFETLGSVPHPMSYGGPVQSDTMHFLHRLGDRIPDGIVVAADVSWGGDFDRLQAVIEANPGLALRTRFFLGYSGWGAGQLEDEIAEGSWLVTSLEPEWVFDPSPDRLWREAILRQGGEIALFANYPDDPRMN